MGDDVRTSGWSARLRFGIAVSTLDQRVAVLTAVVEEFASATVQLDSAIACFTGLKDSIESPVCNLPDIENAFSPALQCQGRFL